MRIFKIFKILIHVVVDLRFVSEKNWNMTCKIQNYYYCYYYFVLFVCFLIWMVDSMKTNSLKESKSYFFKLSTSCWFLSSGIGHSGVLLEGLAIQVLIVKRKLKVLRMERSSRLQQKKLVASETRVDWREQCKDMMKRRAVLLRVWWTSLVMGSSFVAQRYFLTWLIPRVLELTNFLVTNSFSSGAGWRMGKLTYGTCLFVCLAGCVWNLLRWGWRWNACNCAWIRWNLVCFQIK